MSVFGTTLKRQLTPVNYYDGCFDIMHMDDTPIEDVRIRAFYPEYNYIEEVPLHESQQRVGQSADGKYLCKIWQGATRLASA